jgi:hypothetical protein
MRQQEPSIDYSPTAFELIKKGKDYLDYRVVGIQRPQTALLQDCVLEHDIGTWVLKIRVSGYSDLVNTRTLATLRKLLHDRYSMLESRPEMSLHYIHGRTTNPRRNQWSARYEYPITTSVYFSGDYMVTPTSKYLPRPGKKPEANSVTRKKMYLATLKSLPTLATKAAVSPFDTAIRWHPGRTVVKDNEDMTNGIGTAMPVSHGLADCSCPDKGRCPRAMICLGRKEIRWPVKGMKTMLQRLIGANKRAILTAEAMGSLLD